MQTLEKIVMLGMGNAGSLVNLLLSKKNRVSRPRFKKKEVLYLLAIIFQTLNTVLQRIKNNRPLYR